MAYDEGRRMGLAVGVRASSLYGFVFSGVLQPLYLLSLAAHLLPDNCNPADNIWKWRIH